MKYITDAFSFPFTFGPKELPYFIYQQRKSLKKELFGIQELFLDNLTQRIYF
jgi:hypothetical protein